MGTPVDDLTQPASASEPRTTYTRPIVVDRPLAIAVARYIGQPDERVHPLEALARIARRFPGIHLDTALCGFVFRKLLIDEHLPEESLQ
jgi:hypothetical protein